MKYWKWAPAGLREPWVRSDLFIYMFEIAQDKKSFLCPHVKPALHTGTSLADLSPEDIDVVAALGDSLAVRNCIFENKALGQPSMYRQNPVKLENTREFRIMFPFFQSGRGLWAPSEVDFRGAAFPIGGDANIDGLVTIPSMNVFFIFSKKLNLSGVCFRQNAKADRTESYLVLRSHDFEKKSWENACRSAARVQRGPRGRLARNGITVGIWIEFNLFLFVLYIHH